MTTYRIYEDSKQELEFLLAVGISYYAKDRGKW